MSDHNLFRGSIYHCVEAAGNIRPVYISDGLMVVDRESGRVVEVGDYSTLSLKWDISDSLIHFEDRLMMPGFVDTHVHYPQYKVIASYGTSLLEWLNKYTFLEEQKFSNEDYADQIANLFLDELIKNGTTSAMTFCATYKQSVDAFFRASEKRGLRMAAGKVMMDRNAPEGLCDNPEESYRDSKELIEKWHNKARLRYAVTPRFAPTSSSAQLKQAARLLNEYPSDENNKGVLLQTHLNENDEEIAWVSDLFPESKNYFGVYEDHGIAGNRSVFGHCIHNTEAEYQRMAQTESKVSLCPTSNLFLGSGLFELEKLESYGIDVSLASDVGGGDSFSMFKVMNEAYKICRLNDFNLDPVRAFYMTTLGAAKVLDMNDSIGNFEVNKEADFIVIDLNATEIISQKNKIAVDINDILFNLMTLGDDRLIDEVYVLGQRAYKK
ncbi:MAG: guanine deaminase [Candidatus Thioglobus sp.]|jgi:guanine deaminase|nr:guanine deaminase [Candidatus Thioglobus sp.]